MSQFDRSVENVGNIVSLEHVNICTPDQQLALAFYVSGLGLTRDPYLVTGTGNMWVNVGRSQFHLPTRKVQRLRGTVGLVLPGRDRLLARLHAVSAILADSQFSVSEQDDHVSITCPWGNRIRCHLPGERFGRTQLGMPYVELDVPVGTATGIARFYREILGAPASVSESQARAVAHVAIGDAQALIFRETADPIAGYDGHHIAVYLSDFSTPYHRLLDLGLISQEDNAHQYRFVDIVDPDSGSLLFQLEHETRSMRHPFYARPLVNRDPAINVENFMPGHEQLAWARLDAG